MLINNVGNIANRLEYEFKYISSLLSHQGVKGDLREAALRNGLRALIPRKYDIGTGIIMDAHNTQSNQQDFIIYDGFSSPSFLNDETTVILPVESVYAITEIKSRLTAKELERAINNASSVKTLRKNLILPPPGFFMPMSNYIYSSVFAYESDIGMMTLKKRFDEMNQNLPYEQRISTICVLSEGCIVNAHKKDLTTLNTQPSEETITVLRTLPIEQSLYMYYLILQYHLTTNTMCPPNLTRYAHIGKSFESSLVTLDMESIETAGVLKMHGVEIAACDVKRYKNAAQYFDRTLTDGLVAASGLDRDALAREIQWARNWITDKDAAVGRAIAESDHNTLPQ
ncbi:MAG: hypothetical protein PHP02_04645 [Eubacteriales bacterium]|nr:hypothetical protein [Eubacteriales bacterium]